MEDFKAIKLWAGDTIKASNKNGNGIREATRASGSYVGIRKVQLANWDMRRETQSWGLFSSLLPRSHGNRLLGEGRNPLERGVRELTGVMKCSLYVLACLQLSKIHQAEHLRPVNSFVVKTNKKPKMVSKVSSGIVIL